MSCIFTLNLCTFSFDKAYNYLFFVCLSVVLLCLSRGGSAFFGAKKDTKKPRICAIKSNHGITISAGIMIAGWED